MMCLAVDLYSSIMVGTRWVLSVRGYMLSGSGGSFLIIIINFLLHFLSFYFRNHYYSCLLDWPLILFFVIFFIFLYIFCFYRFHLSYHPNLLFDFLLLLSYICVFYFQVFFFDFQIFFIKIKFFIILFHGCNILSIFFNISSPILSLL